MHPTIRQVLGYRSSCWWKTPSVSIRLLCPHLYKFVLEQSQMFAKEALNGHQQTLRMRGRPKIKLARTYEEAVRIFNQYRDNMLGIVSDMSFMHDGVKDPMPDINSGGMSARPG